MQSQSNQEVWLRGPLPGVPPLLQPVAHALLQATEEIKISCEGLDDSDIWEMKYGLASVAFHLQHIRGVLDRLFTYARGEQLSDNQLSYLNREGKMDQSVSLSMLLAGLEQQVNTSIEELKGIPAEMLTEQRFVGRKKLPSTVAGLLFHAAEHTQRHTGQLLVTAVICKKVN